MKTTSLVVALAVALFASVDASAATLTATGSVQVNRGSGFQPVSGMVEVRGGDRVLVGAGGTARIAYTDGCTTSVHPNSLAVVATSAPCSGRMNQAGGGAAGGAASLGAIGGIATGTIVAGAIAAGVLAAVVSNNRSDNRPEFPVSP